MCGIFFCCCLSHKTQATTNHVNSNIHIVRSRNNETFHCQSCYPSSELKVSESGVDDHGHGASPTSASTSGTHPDCIRIPLLEHRGPDQSQHHVFPLSRNSQGVMQGYVLHLRGILTPQPVTDDEGNALLWNGEIFGGIQVKSDENDTQVLFGILSQCTTDEIIVKAFKAIQGPWAFVYWQANAKKLWFGRDKYGRRSLLWHHPSSLSDQFILSSVAVPDMVFSEIPSVGIFNLDFSCVDVVEENETPTLTLHPWKGSRWPATVQKVEDTEENNVLTFLYPPGPSCLPVIVDKRCLLDCWIPDLNQEIPGSDVLTPDHCTYCCTNAEEMLLNILQEHTELDLLAEKLIHVLQAAVSVRVNDIPEHVCSATNHASVNLNTDKENLARYTAYSQAKVAILFSGGLDSTVLAALADRCIPEDEPIDLLNVAFEQAAPRKCNPNLKKKQKDFKKRNKTTKNQHNYNKSINDELPSASISSSSGVCASSQQFGTTQIKHDITTNTNCPVIDAESQLGNVKLSDSSGLACSFCNSTVTTQSKADKFDTSYTEVGTVSVCETCHQHPSPNITSPNITEVSSQHPSLNMASSNFTDEVIHEGSYEEPQSSSYEVPDRVTGRIALSELNPRRQWNFIEVNVTQSEVQSLRQSRIRQLIYPLHTVLDDSIGCAVWFAARGQGVLANDKKQKITSQARVILCGMAADEQFAGYSRHRVTFSTRGWAGLVSEIQEEMWRISARNLGRDDRIITDHGKEGRFPFLDEIFTEFISEIPLYKRADLNLPRGIGEKLLLRLSAVKLGLIKTATQPKRAIQFGSKIAKMDNKKEKGTDVCERLI
ncbi:asparagine synthetase domain-containing protein 1-like [Physella acuta]|uniref:asparagine synthetase domain-containing protein 1-like n=1 Tax=Physella acuta TaxID=109671 RepID=UPI0027DBFAE5|nr:asparagine synthetase domain-containing protein 1-like [Physella acuta]